MGYNEPQTRPVFLPSELVQIIDSVAADKGITRTDLMIDALQFWLNRPGVEPRMSTDKAIKEIYKRFLPDSIQT